MGYPSFAFVFGSFLFLCFVNYVVNIPAIRYREDSLYSDDPQGFFDLKVRFTFWLWVAGISAMVIIFVTIICMETFLPVADPEILPHVSLTGFIITLLFSLAPFIPATFALMKASYEYDGIKMELVSEAMFTIAFVLGMAMGILAYTSPPGFVFKFYALGVFPFLPLSICALAVSLIATFYLIKSAKRSFTEHIESDNV